MRYSSRSTSLSVSFSETKNPVFPSITSSGIPAWRVEMTGRPVAIASLMTFGIPSLSPLLEVALGARNIWAFHISPGISFGSFSPHIETLSPRRNILASSSNLSLRGPPPTILSSVLACFLSNLANAFMPYANPFFSISRPHIKIRSLVLRLSLLFLNRNSSVSIPP